MRLNKKGDIFGNPSPIAGANVGVSDAASAPATGGFVRGSKLWIVLIAFLLIVGLETLGGDGNYILITILLLGVFGFIHFFSPHGMPKFILGVVPMVLAVASVPVWIGGSKFGDLIANIPLIGFITPGLHGVSIVRYIIMAGVFGYYYYFLKNMATRDYYKAMGNDATAVASRGAGSMWNNVKGWKIFVLLLIVAAVYAFENYSSVLGVQFIEDYGKVITGLALVVLGIVFLFVKRGFAFKLMGVVSLVLGIVNFLDIISNFAPAISSIFDNDILGSIKIGETSAIRYLFIAVIIFYFMFKNEEALQRPVA